MVIMTMVMMVLQHQDDIKVDMGIHTMELDLSSLIGSMKEDPRSSPEPPGKPYAHYSQFPFFWSVGSPAILLMKWHLLAADLQLPDSCLLFVLDTAPCLSFFVWS